MNIVKRVITTAKDWYNLCIFGDWHYGHQDCDIEKLNSVTNFLSKQKSDSYGIFVVGDLNENVVLGSKGTAFECDPSDPRKQKEDSAKRMESLEHILLGAVEGNHELRTRQRTGNYLVEDILDKAFGKNGSKYYLGISSLVILQFKTPKGKLLQSYRVYVTHGTGNSSSVSGKITKLYNLRDKALADIYIQGHLHQRLITSDYIIDNDGTLRKRIFACCSSYLIDASYAQEFGFNPTDYGINKLSINTKTNEIIGYI